MASLWLRAGIGGCGGDAGRPETARSVHSKLCCVLVLPGSTA